MNGPARIAIVGAGAWATALAITIARAGSRVTMIGRDRGVVAAINDQHQNPDYLPGIDLDPAIRADTDIAVVADHDAVLAVVPAQTMRDAATRMRPHLAPGTPVISCAKGIEQSTKALMTDVLGQELPDMAACVLSGPSFAVDVARGLPTAVTLAVPDEAVGETLMRAIGHAAFRLYLSTDVIGAEVGGAVKNVLAIACGIVEGRALGASARAALTARGFAELNRFGLALGAQAETMAGLSGLGDLILTCSSAQSRNFSLGLALGQGEPIGAILAESRRLTEGMWTASALIERATDLGVDMPISWAVAEIVAGRASVDDAIEGLLARPFKRET